MTEKKFRYIKKENQLQIRVGNAWETWYINIGFEVNDPNNERNSIRFDEVLINKIGRLLLQARNNNLFNKFEKDKKNARRK